jgi:hypothetical protein
LTRKEDRERKTRRKDEKKKRICVEREQGIGLTVGRRKATNRR